MRKLTKVDLEKLAKEIRRWASKNELGKEWSLFYNGIMLHYPLEIGDDGLFQYRRLPIREETNPLDYCEYFPEQFIMGMSYDGVMYHCINGYDHCKAYDKLEGILSSYGLYLEHCDSCHACMCEAEDDMEVEYTVFSKPKEYVLIRPGRCYERWSNEDIYEYPKILDFIMNFWKDISSRGHHDGSCIIGEGIEFDLEGKHYNMSSQCVYQGSIHFEQTAKSVVDILKRIATNVTINYGRLD